MPRGSRAATLAFIALPSMAPAQRLMAPATARMDEVLDLRASGLRPGQRVTLRASMADSVGALWRSTVDFVADSRGTVVPGRDASLRGAYTGVDAMGLVTAMDRPDQPGSSRYTSPRRADVSLGIALVLDGRVADSVTVVRRYTAPDVRVSQVREPGGPRGTLFRPKDDGRRPAIVVLGGSEGGNSAADVAAQLSGHGYVTLSLAYFAFDSLPSALDEIPVEYFTQAITYLARQPNVDSRRIAIFGSSKGAEAALLVASRDPRVRAVVAYAPSSVVWSCICGTAAHSSWSAGGTPVPNVPPGRDPSVQVAAGQPQRPVVHYRHRMRDSAAVTAAAISVERIRGPVMLVAGDADELWPSGEMARQVRARLAAARARPPGDSALIYPEAGHLIGKSYLPAGSTRVAGGRMETGGAPRANALAQADAWPKVLRFLSSPLAE